MNQSQTGFTLIELLIVVAIIGILAAIAVPSFLNAHLRAKIAGTQNDLRIMVNAMMQYHLDNNSYHAHRDGAGQQFPLTTPVPYLTHFLHDRFQARPNMQFEPGYENSYSFYHWIPAPTHEDWWPRTGWRGHRRINDIMAVKNGGIIDGWGPAGVRGGPPYDVSNGLLSIGGFFIQVPPGQKIHLNGE
jgi:type II secretion system protein G